MTRSPVEDRVNVRGIAGLEYTMPRKCAVPGCAKEKDHAHHLFSRGLMGGAYTWVKLPDDTETGNLIPICYHHHEQITDNASRIVWMDDAYHWVGKEGTVELLSWQPPVVRDGVTLERQAPVPVEHVASESHVFHDGHVHDTEQERAVCPTCKQRLPRPKIESVSEEPKQRKTWAVSVPVERLEDGAEVLDELLEAARDEMDKVGLEYSDSSKAKYHVLSAALGLFVTHAQKVLGSS